MRNREIYISALHLLGEDVYAEENADYEERAPYLLAAFVSEASPTDDAFRAANGLEAADKIDNVCVPLDETFPLCDRFAAVASSYLAAMLVIDDDIELSDKLFDKYCDGMAKIQSSIPTKIEKIAQKYL